MKLELFAPTERYRKWGAHFVAELMQPKSGHMTDDDWEKPSVMCGVLFPGERSL